MRVRWALAGIAVVALAGVGAYGLHEHLQTRQLSAGDEAELTASSAVIYDWCLARKRPAGGTRRLSLAIEQLDHLADHKPRRRTEVSDSSYVTPREQVTNLARSMNGTCRRPVPGSETLRRRALVLAENREGHGSTALPVQEVRRRLARIAPVVALDRTPGPQGTVTLRGFVRRRGEPALRIAVILGRDAARKSAAYQPGLVPGASNKTATHPVDGIDTAVILDTRGLVGAPYTQNASLPRSARSMAQRRGDLRNAAERALVGEVPQ